MREVSETEARLTVKVVKLEKALEKAQERIAQLEEEVDDMYREVRGRMTC